jgi:glycosyltransferase involved in cell wall biosynthesis
LIPHILYVGGEDHHLRIPFMLLLRERGFRITAAGTGDGIPFARAGLEFRRFRFERYVNPLADIAAIRDLAKLLAGVRPDFAQTCDTKPSLLVPLAARQVPGVRVVRNINGRGWLYSSGSPAALVLRPTYRFLHQMAARSTTKTVFEIRDDEAFFERHRMIGRGGSLVIPGAGIDVERFDDALAQAPPPSQLRDELGLNAVDVVMTVTRLTRHKGIPTLLEAAAQVCRERPSTRFVLVGPREAEGPLAVSQAEIDKYAPYVMAIGPRSDVPALLKLADLFAFPTEYREGIPRVLLEAALAGAPIVTTTMPGCCEVVQDGWNGFRVPPRSPQVLARRIVEMLRDRTAAREMAARAQMLVKEKFSLRVVVDCYAALYSDLSARRGHSPQQRQDPSHFDTEVGVF